MLKRKCAFTEAFKKEYLFLKPYEQLGNKDKIECIVMVSYLVLIMVENLYVAIVLILYIVIVKYCIKYIKKNHFK